jgi:ATP-dependent helicase/nuclease subunit B
MGVRFIIGRAGSGKTGRCFDRIVRECREEPLGPPIYWLLPRQATFQAERQLVCASGLAVVCRALVLSFSQLGELVSQQCGGIAIPQTTAGGRQMILGHLLRTHQNELQFFRSVARQPGLAGELDQAFSELERYGKSADDVLAERGDGGRGGDPVSAKFHDLQLLYAKYTEYLGQDWLDPHRRQRQVIECIGAWPALEGASIYVDGFFDFAEQERQLLAALARGCAAMEITLLMDPGSAVLGDSERRPEAMSLFYRTEQTYRRLRESFRELGVAVEEPVLLGDAQKSATAALKRAESQLFGRAPRGSGDAEGIHLIEAPSRRAEVDAVARHIRGLVKDGLRFRDVAVLGRDLDPYHDLIAASFAEHELPCFIDRRRPAAHHPLVRFLRFLPALAGGQWPHDAMMGMLKSGLLGVSPDEADEVENYVLAHRIRGSAWAVEKAWAYRGRAVGNEGERSTEEEAALARIDQIRRRVAAQLQPISTLLRDSAPLPVRGIVEEISKVFEGAGIRQTLAKWIADAKGAGELEEAAAREQVWTEIDKLLGQMVDLLGEEAVTPAEFTDILETGLEQFDLGLTPPTVDEILVSTFDRTRTPTLKAIVLIGWHDGGFPRRPGNAAIISDGDRERMSIGGDSERLLLDERLWAYFAVTRSTHHLCITRPTADDAGKQFAPSPYWGRIEALFPDALRTILQRDCEEDCIGTERELATALMRWARNPEDGIDEKSPWAALYQRMVALRGDGAVADQVVGRAWGALGYCNEAVLSPEVGQRLFSSPLAGRIARIESFAACPFQHFAAYGLGLRGRAEPDVTGMDLSRIYHSVLQNVVGDMVRNKRDWTEASPRTHSLIHAHTAAVGQRLRDEIMLSTSRNQYLLQRVEKTLEQVMAAQEAAIARGQFRPAKVDLRFGDGARWPAFSVATPKGNRVDLSGSIDRIDIVKTPEGDHVSVMDYRMRGEGLALDRVYHGLSLQLLTYLLVLEAGGEKLAGRPLTPAAAFYVRLLRQLEDIRHPSEAIGPEDPRFDLQVKPRGMFDARFVRALDSELTTGASDVVQVFVNKDGNFGKRNQSDAAAHNEFTALLRLVRLRIGETVDRLLSGDIRVMPVRIRQESPCVRCDFRSVCRFDVGVNRYRVLEAMNREEVLSRSGMGVPPVI